MSVKTPLKDLKVNQCFTFPMYSTVYYVMAQYTSLGRTKVSPVVAQSKHGQLYESDTNVLYISSEDLPV